ncbi:MAG: hypothetical protein LBP19_02035 [Treponema sp.]|jgi:hypothetical protein|nr:hypothetical protein [Treponema sp.]
MEKKNKKTADGTAVSPRTAIGAFGGGTAYRAVPKTRLGGGGGSNNIYCLFIAN